MSGVEIGIAVIGAVAALVSAYKDAGSIVQNIKERRKAKGALPPSVALQESLVEGYQEIEKITDNGIKRFGSGFRQGDDIAHRALQSLTVEVQASLLHHLTLASKDDTVTDFEACIDSAIEARLKAVNILNELYLRQQKSCSLHAEPEVGMIDQSGGPIDRGGQKERKESSETPLPSPTMVRKSSWNLFKNRHRASSGDQPRENSPTSSLVRNSSFGFTDPTRTLTQRTTMSASPGSWIDSPGARQSQLMTPPISPVSTEMFPDALATAGLCIGASYAQQGVYEKSVKVSVKNLEWSCHCRKCLFATPADRDKSGEAQFDDRVYATPKLRFRSLFLFKSHLASSQKKRRLYKCLICVLGGDFSSTYEGEHSLIEHTSHHSGAILGQVGLLGPICLDPTGARVGTEGTFDLYFPNSSRFTLPPSAMELDDVKSLDEDRVHVWDEDEVFKNQWADERQR